MDCRNPLKCRRCRKFGHKINTYRIWLRDQGYFDFPNARDPEVHGRGRGRVPFYRCGRFNGRFGGRSGGFFFSGRGGQVGRSEGSEASGGVQGLQNVQIVRSNENLEKSELVEKTKVVVEKSGGLLGSKRPRSSSSRFESARGWRPVKKSFK